MKKLSTLLLSLGLLLSAVAQNQSAAIDSLISTYAKMSKFNGVAMVASKGKILLSKGYGYQDVANNIPNTANSIFLIGSITKQFTSAVIQKLQEENKLQLSDKLSKYFPGYPKGDSITIEQLLSHTSGVYNYTKNRGFMEKETTQPQSKEKMMALFKDEPLDFTPGSKWSYSNSGYSLLGYIIEAVTNNSYEAAVHKYIFKPLKMNKSGFDFTHLKSKDKSTGYFIANATDTLVAHVVDSTVSFSAGAIYSTIGDLYRWHNALQNNTVLSMAQQEKAYTPVKNKYGYGWFIDSVEGKRRVGHTGGIPGYITLESRLPEEDVFVVLLSNASNKSIKDIEKSIYAILYNKPYELPKEKKSVTLPAATLQQYVGEYELMPNFTLTVSIKGAGIGLLPTGDKEKVVLAEKEDVFFESQDDVQVVFIRNEQQQVTGLELNQGGRKTMAKKIK